MHHSHPSNGGPPPPPLPPPPLGPPMPPHGVYGAHPHIHPPPHGHMPPPPPPPPQSHPGMDQRPKDGIPYIGSRISLISKTDIRYEGFLYNIDTRQSMVALQHVRSFGTEGRRPEHIPPSDQVLPYATFKASEIKDLHVCEAAPSPMYGGGGYAPPMPPPPSMAHGQGPPPMQPYQQFQPPVPTPAPVQTSVPSSPPQKPQEPVVPSSPAQKPITTHSLLTPGSVSNAKQSVTTKPTSPVHTIKQKTPISSPVLQPESPKRSTSSTPSTGNNGNTTRGRTIPGMGGHLLKRKERRVPNGEGTTTVSSGSDFNFETGLNDFDKEEEFSKLSLSEVKETKGTYQKSSFFDTISCDALDRLEGKLGRVTASEERKLNSETFGAVGLNNRRSFRGGRGGNGGNRRGRGRGRGNSGEGNSRSGGSSRNRGGGNAWYQNSGNETRA